MYMFLDIRCYPPPPFPSCRDIFFLELHEYINITIGYMSLNIRCTPPPTSFPGCRDFFLERSIKALFYFLFKIRK